MSAIATHPMPTVEDALPTGSHLATRDGRDVVVHGVELYRTTDDGGSGGFGPVDSERLGRIVNLSNERINGGQYVQIVVQHKINDEDVVMPDSIGRIDGPLRIENRMGEQFVVGDMRLREYAFQDFVASNRYPRRSVEIMPVGDDGAIVQLALLGRETPRQNIRDVIYNSNEAGFVGTSLTTGDTDELLRVVSGLSDDDKATLYKALEAQMADDDTTKEESTNTDDTSTETETETETVDNEGTIEKKVDELETALNTANELIAKQTATIDSLVAARNAQDVSMALNELEQEGIVLNREKESEYMLSLNADHRAAHIQIMRTNYKKNSTKAVQHAGTVATRMASATAPAQGATVLNSDAELDAIVNRAAGLVKTKGLSLNEAMKEAQNV